MVVANVGVSIPVFVLGLLLAYVFAVVLKDTPSRCRRRAGSARASASSPLAERMGPRGLQGPPGRSSTSVRHLHARRARSPASGTSLVDAFRHLILPAIALGTIPLAIIARITRSSLLDVLGLDYMRTARAKGLGERLVVVRHAMRNALLPVVTVIGLPARRAAVGGAVLTETIFNLPASGGRCTRRSPAVTTSSSRASRW